jgi:RHS repeat-associated protein
MESGLDYSVFRYYGSGYGLFTSPDRLAGRLGSPQSLNGYAYVLNDPLNLVDPLGLDDGVPWKCVGTTCWIGSGSTTVDVFGGGWPTGGLGGGGRSDGSGDFFLLFMGGKGGHQDLKSEMLRALLTNPDCRTLFGGLQNALNALFGTNYFDYTPGMSNPDPGFIPPGTWSQVSGILSKVPAIPPPGMSAIQPAITVYDKGPGGTLRGDTLLAPIFSYFPSGFSTDGQDTQMTIAFHELEHVSSQSNAPDANYGKDLRNINEKCQPKNVATQ